MYENQGDYNCINQQVGGIKLTFRVKFEITT
jgi:hypothetical protein